MARLLVVDDDQQLRESLVRLLESFGHQCAFASSAEEARARLHATTFDLVLTDVAMPGDSGIDLLRELKRELPDVAAVMVTGIDREEIAREAIEIGAFGYVVKPFQPNEIKLAVLNALRRRDLERQQRLAMEELEQKVFERSTALREAITRLEEREPENSTAEKLIVDRLAKALSLRDEETGEHIERMSRYCAVLARKEGFNEAASDEVRLAATLHDVGKIGIPDNILLKPAKLTDGEFDIIKRHAVMGHRLLAGSASKILALGAVIALTHHERWDGTGYPGGLSRDGIPLEGRVAAIADVFDAITSDRVYRPAFSIDEAISMIRRDRGTHFDPFLVDVFLDSIDDIVKIREEFPEPDPVRAHPITVLLVDDQLMFADSLVRVLDDEHGLRVIARAGSVAEAEKVASETKPDVVLMDWELPDGTGDHATVLIRGRHPETKVVILTGYSDENILRRAIESGCSGYVSKTRAIEEVASAIRLVHAGESLFPVSLVQSVLTRMVSKNEHSKLEAVSVAVRKGIVRMPQSSDRFQLIRGRQMAASSPSRAGS